MCLETRASRLSFLPLWIVTLSGHKTCPLPACLPAPPEFCSGRFQRKCADPEHAKSVNGKPRFYCSHLSDFLNSSYQKGKANPVWFAEGVSVHGAKENSRHQGLTIPWQKELQSRLIFASGRINCIFWVSEHQLSGNPPTPELAHV